MTLLENVVDAGADALLQGAGAFVASSLLISNSDNLVNVPFTNAQMQLNSAIGATVFGITLMDDLIARDYLIPNLPLGLQRYVSTADMLGKIVVQGALPGAALYMSNPGGSLFDVGLVGVSAYAGSAIGAYTNDNFVRPLLNRFI